MKSKVYEYPADRSEQKSRSHLFLRRQRIRRLFTGALMLVFVLGFVIFYNTTYAQDAAEHTVSESDISAANNTKYYKTVEIHSGDSLWSLAELYMDENYDSVKDYVQELKEINHLDSDSIQDGQYLTVAYYL